MNIVENNKYNEEFILRKVGFVILALLFLIVFESKALINILAGFSLLASLIYIGFYERNILQNNRYLLVFIVPYVVGFSLSFLSYSGSESALDFLDRFKFMLLVLPLSVFVKKRKDLHILLTMFFVSAVIAICYAIYTKQPYGNFKGFYKIGRTSDMMIIACLAALVYLIMPRFVISLKNILLKLLVAFATALFAWAIIMSEMRGAWLGLMVGFISFIFLLLLLRRNALIFKLLTVLTFVLSIMYFGNIGNIDNNINRINNQFKSISQTQDNYSNEARLHLWKTGWDFSKNNFIFGTGVKQSKEMFIKFFNDQSDDYQKKYHLAIRFPGDYHNSYLQVHVETGIIFLFLYMTSFLYPLFIILKNIKRVPVKDQKYLIAAITTSIAFLVTQFFHNELYSFGSTVFYLVLFSGCYILHQNNPDVWLNKGHKI